MALREIDGRLFLAVEVDDAGYFDVANAALFIGRTKGYVRALARKGVLEHVVDETGKVSFHRDVLEEYNAHPKRGGRKAGAIPYRTLSSAGRKLRSVILIVEGAEFDEDQKAITIGALQALLAADVEENKE